jgi:predicted acyl esterase
MRAMRHSLALWLLAAGCSSAPDGNASFSVRESVEQLHVTHAKPGATVDVVDAKNMMVATGTADNLGSLMFRNLPPGSGYLVKSGAETSRHLTVKSVENSQPPPDFYRSQKLQPGYNYLRTRDGTTLSVWVTLPGPAEMGPYPTVVDYSGYAPSRPGEPIQSATFLCDQLPILCAAPSDAAALLAGLFGYATVSVNMRGTGCSGGAYDFFEQLQLLDGYDVIETAAAQSWVLHHKVGMVGLSYPGITQLFVASVKPPSLAAITPLSVIGNAETTLIPGGILNDGFALAWVTNVLDGAKPYGQGWEQGLVDKGDLECKENQLLHGQLLDNVAQARMTQFYDPALHDRYNPTVFVDKIEVPVFMAGQWEDEQTGPFFFTLLDKFKNSAKARIFVHNGVHPDGFSPDVLSDWQAFLELFVAQRVPTDVQLVRDLSPTLYDQIFHSPMRLELSKFAAYGSYDEAVAAWKAQPLVNALFESGAGMTDDLGAPKPTFNKEFATWPPPETQAQRWYFRADGSLSSDTPSEASAASVFSLDPDAGERGILAQGGNVWDKLPQYDWRQPAAGKAVVFESPALGADEVMVGTGSVDLWVKANVDDGDLEVNLSEVRPDGQEMYVQSGWLRASYRGLGPDATELFPSPTYQQKDWKPLTPGEWTQVRVAIAGFQHIFRAGSRIRVMVDTPGDSRAEWRFALKTFAGDASYTIGHDMAHPSSVALPLLAGVTAPTAMPPCPSLRGQQCRAHQSYTNTVAQ